MCYNTGMSNTEKTLSALVGTAIPLSALKTDESCGCGEFLDLIPFAEFCKKCGLKLIQLLPVNDTGTESSPYSALSAFALNPLYVRLQALPEASGFAKDIKKIAKAHVANKRFDYKKLRHDKIDLLVKIFAANKEQILQDKKLASWIKANPWIINYAVFMEKKRENLEASCKTWKNFRNPSLAEIKTEWANPSKKMNHYFFAWVQMRLDEQFSAASKKVKSLGLLLKGDIPIMMNEDSADVWAYPECFIDNLRAGSPPDDYNPVGQNWGFPIYDWEYQKKDGFSWWKARLATAEKYYQAYRIDHVLGFFRIWAVPKGEHTAVLGYTQPLVTISAAELEKLGFDEMRIRWLSKPHVPTYIVQQDNNDYLYTHGQLEKVMNRIGQEEMWLFKDEIKTEDDIWTADIEDGVKKRLAECWRDRALIEISKNKYTAAWCHTESASWKSLSDEEREKLSQLIAEKQRKMEKLWEKQAKELLQELVSSVDMTACAEDLGANPPSVPKVMKSLNILGLRVLRWTRDWYTDGQPYIAPEKYPQLSVAASSVHDSSTIRGWWLNENAGKDFIRDFGAEKNISPDVFTPETAEYILKKLALAKSSFCIHPFQDFLYLSSEYYDKNPDDERINIPGSISEFNWTYRIPRTVEALVNDTELIAAIKKICALHK